MGRNIFLSVLTLIAGICLGILGIFFFFEPAPPVQPVSPVPSVSVPHVPASPSAPAPTQTTTPDTAVLSPSVSLTENQVLLERAFQVLSALKAYDLQALSTLVHPLQGVVFTPYSTVDLEANLHFTPAQITALQKDATKYVWGISDGKGAALELTAEDYFERYVYNADYAQAPLIGIDRVIGSGNALENVSEVFPDSRFVEFYFPGISPEYNGFDWCGLKLVFSEYQGEHKLVAIIHSEWTI